MRDRKRERQRDECDECDERWVELRIDLPFSLFLSPNIYFYVGVDGAVETRFIVDRWIIGATFGVVLERGIAATSSVTLSLFAATRKYVVVISLS